MLCKNAEKHVKKVARLVEDLLNTTKLELGQLALNRTMFEASDVIDSCCTPIIAQKEFSILVEGNLAMKIYADQYKIEQVLLNFLTNAMKYAASSKQILIRVEHVDNNAKISVTDRGPGIEKEKISHVFDRFYRIDNSESGSGLGFWAYTYLPK